MICDLIAKKHTFNGILSTRDNDMLDRIDTTVSYLDDFIQDNEGSLNRKSARNLLRKNTLLTCKEASSIKVSTAFE